MTVPRRPASPVSGASAAAAAAPAALALCASARVKMGEREHTLSPIDALLFAWLAIEGPTPRERLAALLWPESAPEAARNALRQRLFRLRRQLGRDLVDGAAVLSLAAGVTHDLEGAAALLGEMRAAESPELDAWLTARRAQLLAQARPAQLARIEALETAGDAEAALPLALQLLAADPLSEDAHRRVMRLHYLRGDRAAALRAFDDCERTLKDEIGTTPSAATRALLATIEAEQHSPATGGEGAVDAPPLRGPLPAAVLRPPRLVGRAAELAALRQGWRAGQVLLVSGEAGIGKSRLLQALASGPVAAWSEARGGTGADWPPQAREGLGTAPGARGGTGTAMTGAVVLAAARPGDDLVPCAALGRLLQGVVGRHPAALAAVPAEARRRLAPLLPAWIEPDDAAMLPRGRSVAAPRHGTLLPPLRALLAAAARGGAAADADAAAAQAFATGGDAPAALQALILDDLHFADDASLELLQALLAGEDAAEPQPSLRWCLGLRPPQPGTRLQALVAALEHAAPLQRVPVQPLTVAQVAELVDSLGLPGVDGAALAPALRQRSGGNPLFALETLKLAWTEGTVGAGAVLAGVAAPAGGTLPRPQSLAQLIAQQLSRLSSVALALARVAAVAGPDFALPLAEQVTGQGALQLADPWHELEAQQVLVGTEFAHDLVYEAVLAGVPAVIARHLHGQVAECLEAGGGEPARVAAHWEAAGRRDRALPSLRAAAERAHRALRERERIEFLLRAADIAEATGAPDEAFECVDAAVHAHADTIRQTGGFPLLDRLDRLARSPAQRARAVAQRAWYCSQLPDHTEAARLGAQALALAEPLGDAARTGVIRQRLATALAMLGRFDEALAHLGAIQGWADAELGDALAADYHGHYAVVLDNLGRPGAAQVRHLRAVALAQRGGDTTQRATLMGNQAVNRLNAGDAVAAEGWVEQALALVTGFDLHGDSVAFLWLLRAQCARALGRWADALAAADRAAALLERSNPARVPMARLQRAHTWLELGQHGRAGPELQACLGAPLPPHLRGRALLLQARWQRERALDPRATLAEAAAAAPAGGWPEVRLAVALEAADAALDSGRADAAPQAAASALRVLSEAEGGGLLGVALAARLVQVRAALAQGQAPLAVQAARAALQLAAGTGGSTAQVVAPLIDPATAPATAPAVVPAMRPRAELWLRAAQGLAATPEGAAEAAATARAGAAWLTGAAAMLDPAWVESCLARNPVHAALRALGARQ